MIAEKFDFYKNEVEQFGNSDKWISRLSENNVAASYPKLKDKASEEDVAKHTNGKTKYMDDNIFTDAQIQELRKIEGGR